MAEVSKMYPKTKEYKLNPLNAQLNPIYHLLALLGAHLILHVSRIRVKSPIIRNYSTSSTCYHTQKPLFIYTYHHHQSVSKFLTTNKHVNHFLGGRGGETLSCVRARRAVSVYNCLTFWSRNFTFKF